MDKRGVSPVFWLLEVVFAIAVLIVATSMAHSAATGGEAKRIFLAKDLALTIDSLYAAPGDVTINYLTDEFEREQILTIMNDSVSIVPSTRLRSIITYSFTPDLGIGLSDTSFNLETDGPTNIIIIKRGNQIAISKE